MTNAAHTLGPVQVLVMSNRVDGVTPEAYGVSLHGDPGKVETLRIDAKVMASLRGLGVGEPPATA